MIEIWLGIKGFEGYYEVSNYGNVRSLDREVVNKGSFSGLTLRKGKELKQTINRLGYHVVTLQKNGKRFFKIVHRLVAEAFISNANNKNEVNHIDRNKSNNCVDNLEWCNRKENVNHYYDSIKTTSKYKGVSYQKNRNKWYAYVDFEGRRISLGRFDTEEKANIYRLKFIKNYGKEN